MTELRIYDEVPENPGFLVPISRLLEALDRVDSNLASAPLGLGRRLEAVRGTAAVESDKNPTIVEASKELLSDLRHDRAAFATATFVNERLGIEFGIFDSTFLFVRAPDDLCHAVASRFQEVELVAAAESG